MPIEKRVLKIVSDILKIPENKISVNDKLIDLVSDSIQLFELLVGFERELGEKIKYEDVAHIERISDIVDYATFKITNTSSLK